MHPARFTFFGAVLVSCISCTGKTGGDPHSNHGVPPPAGKELRIKQITDPGSDQRANHLDNVSVSGAVVIAVDTHDETQNGKGRGTIYVQDLGVSAERCETAEACSYSGISLFAPEFVPGNLRVGPGDVLDLTGTFQENPNIGSAMFAKGATLPQLARPTATFRFEDRPPEPIDINVEDLKDYDKGRKWLSMLVRVHDVTVYGDVHEDGQNQRVSAPLLAGDAFSPCEDPFPKVPTLTNELVNLNDLNIKANTKVKSIVGVVTFFCNLHLSPRSLADVQIQ